MGKSFTFTFLYKFIITSTLLMCFLSNINAQVSGKIFKDFNANGVFDTGVSYNEIGQSGVLVNAFSPSGSLTVTYTGGGSSTNSTGEYSVSGGTLGQIRLEFTMPNNTFASNGNSGGTSVMFPTGATQDLAVNFPGEYCQSNPSIVLPCYESGNAFYPSTGAGNSNKGIINMPYNSSGSTPTGISEVAKIYEIGTVWGMGFQQNTKRAFASSVLRRHSGLGPQGLGGIYVLDFNSGNGSITNSFSLEGVIPANGGSAISLGSVTRTGGSDYVLPNSNNTDNIDLDAFDKVGKVGYGDLDYEYGANRIWTVNLFQKALISIDISSTTTYPGNVNQYLLSDMAGFPTCSNGEIRPWGLGFSKEKGYIGLVCTQENAGTASGLRAYIYSFNPNNPTTLTLEIDFPLDFAREPAAYGSTAPANWKPWVETWAETGLGTANQGEKAYPQPIISDIEFSDNGDMVIGFADRWGFQIGFQTFIPVSGTTRTITANSAGDAIKVCNINGTWVLEGANGCAENDNSSAQSVSQTDGPSGTGEFFYSDSFTDGSSGHNEIFLGGLSILPGTNELVTAVFDPFNGNFAYDLGLLWHNLSTGERQDAFMIVNTGAASSKGNDLGDIIAICNPAPLEIGNRVFMDTDSDGEQDADEMGLDGIKVELWKAGSKVTETTTANGGQWYFANVDANTAYEVKILAADIPSGKQLTTANTSSNGKDLIDSDASLVGTNAVIAYTTGSAGQNNHSLDFGFKIACNLTASATGTNVTCNAGTNGTATATPTGNLAAVTYLWSNGATTVSLTTLAAGTYTVTVTESVNCTATANYTVTEPADITLACAKTDATTNGGNDGTATVTATGGTSPYTYLWSNGATTASITGLTAGTFTVTVTDANGCSDVCSSQVNEPSCNLTASATGTNVTCNAGTNGTAAATPTGNLSPVTYVWSNGATTVTISNLTAGTYNVTVTESANCTATANYTVTEPSDITLACAKTDVTIISGSDGTATVTALGGTSPYTYVWSNGTTTASITGLTAGTYTVTTTDANGCSDVCSSQVNEPSCNLTASATGTNVTCNAGTNGTATATPTGNLAAVTYLWSNGATTATISNLTAGTYAVTVTESANCVATANYTVTEPSDITLACAKTDVTTTGGNNGTATVTASGGTSPYTYLWSNGATTASITGLTAGTYTVTTTDANGCSDVCSSQVNEPSCNLTASATGTNVTCNAGTNGTATATPSGNLSLVTYVWSNGETTATISTLTAGTYTVTVTESANCTATANYTVTEPSDITLACAKTDVTTTGGSDGTATVTATGGTSPYTYVWSNGATTASITGLTAGTYTVTVTDANGCSDVCSSQVNEPGCNLTASATGTNVTCNAGNNGTATATPSGNLSPVTYIWSNGETTATISNLTAGTYAVTVTESANCTATANYIVTEPSDITLACAKTDVTITGGSDGTATVTATGGTSPYTYVWSNGATTDAITSLTAGTFTVTVADANGCSDICSSQVNEPGCNLTASATGTNVTCNAGTNGTATATPTGNLSPVTYVWSNGETTATISNLTAGTYTVTVTESANCTATANYIVTEPSDITLACAKTDVTTISGSDGTANVTATGGISPYTYLWSNGATTASITGLTAGTFTVTVTDANGCSDICNSQVNEPGCNLTASATGTNVTCNAGTNGTATATPTGNLSPVTYVWSNGEKTATISNLAAGTYTVTVTESVNCTATANYIVTEPSDITLACAKTDVTTISGSDGTATVTVTGGTSPYTYVWSNGATTASITNLTAGTYTVTVTDANGCSDICGSQINEPGCNLTASATGTNVTCNAGTNGTATATPTGNLSPVTYVWSNGATTATISTLAAGTYNVTVTESANCTATANYIVTEPSDITLACAKTDVTTTGGSDGTATVTATGGTSPYTYLWSNGATTASITGLTAGTFTVTVTDANGCSDICNSQVNEPGCNLTASATGTNVTCNAGTNGTATATPTGNLSPVTYVWSNGATTATISNLTAGTYTVTVTESANCVATANYTVTEPSDITLACAKTDVTTTGGSDGTANVTATGGTSPYTYIWSNGATTVSIIGLTAGTFTVTVTDANGCSDVCGSQVNEPGCNLAAATVVTQPSCSNNDGSISLTITGANAPTFLWSNGATTKDINGLSSGDYTVTITDGNCTITASDSLAIKNTSTPYYLCVGEQYLLEIDNLALTNIQWYKNGILISGAVASTYIATSAGIYTYTSNNISGCNVGQCCPIEILPNPNCCKPVICAPVKITRKR